MKNKKVKKIIAAVIALVLAAAIVIALLPSRGMMEGSITVNEQVLSASPVRGSITEAIITGGSIEEDEGESVALAGKVKISEWMVSEGDYVENGALLATVDKNSVMSSISDVSEMLEKLDSAIEEAKSDTVSSSIYAPAAGKVKKIFAETGRSVVDTVYENGALMLLSLDGLMAVDIEAGELSVGSTVPVSVSDGSTYQGTVSEIFDGTATVTVSDDDTEYAQSVTVKSSDGTVLGTGELYIHRQMKVNAIAGTVSSISVKENASVSSGKLLMSLTDTTYSANYEKLLDARKTLEAQLEALFDAYETGGIYAPFTGSISYINDGEYEEEDSTMSMMPQMSWGGSTSGAAPAENVQPSGEGENQPPEQGPQESAGTEKIGRIQTITLLEDGSYEFVIALSDGTAVTLNSQQLGTLLTGITMTDIQEGDVLILTYSEDGQLTKAALYQQSSSNSGDMPSGGFSGGVSFGTVTATEEEEEADYSVAETELCTITVYDKANVIISVDELDIAKLYVGMEVTATLDAIPGERFDAVISDIDPDGENSGGNTKYSVTVTMDRTDKMLSGMNANITAELAEHGDLLLIPAEALQEDEGGTYVYTSYNEKDDELSGKMYVETGLSDADNIAVTDGLTETDTVYYRYADSLIYTFAQRK